MENANSRKFKTPLLHEWVKENRDVILSAMFSLVKNWIDKGKKEGSIPFASFPNWASVCGGIMESAGYLSPCTINKDSIAFSGDSETADMKELFEICFEHFPNKSMKKKDIINLIQEESLFSYLDFEKRSSQINFGLKIKRFVGRVLSNIKLTIDDTSIRTSRQEYIFRKEDGNDGNDGNVSPMSDYSGNNIYIKGKSYTNYTIITTYHCLESLKITILKENEPFELKLEKGIKYPKSYFGDNSEQTIKILEEEGKIKK